MIGENVTFAALIVASILFMPTTTSTITQVNQITETYMVTSTTLVTRIEIYSTLVVHSRTEYSTIRGGGEAPRVFISDIQWNPPYLSFYIQNRGGAGFVSLVVSAGGTSRTLEYHVDAHSTTLVSLTFVDYLGSGWPVVEVVDQIPDLSTRTETVVIYDTRTSQFYTTRTDPIIVTQQLTSSIETGSSQSPNPGGPTQDGSLRYEYLLIGALGLAFLGAIAWRKRRRAYESEDKTRVY